METDGVDIQSISGYSCPRGREYAVHEVTNPLRMVTSTVKVRKGEKPLLPVKTSKPIPKGLIMACMTEINKVTVTAPVQIGDVIIPNVMGTEADIVATGCVGEKYQ